MLKAKRADLVLIGIFLHSTQSSVKANIVFIFIGLRLSCHCINFLCKDYKVQGLDAAFHFVVLEKGNGCFFIVSANYLVADKHNVVLGFLISAGGVSGLVKELNLLCHTVLVEILRIFSLTGEPNYFVEFVNLF